MYKTKLYLTPLMNFFDDAKNDLNLNTRSRTRKKLKVPLFKSSITQKYVKYQGAPLWNSLSLNFKKNYLFENFPLNINPISSKTMNYNFIR